MKKKREKKNVAVGVDRYPWSWFIDDQRTWDAIDSLLEYGLCEELVVPMLREVCVLPGLWCELSHETLKERHDRRTKLAKKIRQLAYAIEQDPEARHFRVWDADALTTTPIDGKPTVANYLRGFSDRYEDMTGNNLREAALNGRATTRMKLHEFVSREVAILLMDHLKNPKLKPITAATNLTNALLCSAIPYYCHTVTNEQLKQTFRQIKTRRV